MQTKTISRREMLRRSAALSALASAQLAWPAWMPRMAFAQQKLPGDVLVVVFLRGGADGLNIIVPHAEAEYYQARPRLAIPRPDDTKADAKARALELDGFFGLNPAAGGLLPLFQGGQMVAVHATGSPDPTRSHFDAMSKMERGAPGSNALNNGWIGRHLIATETGKNSLVRAFGWGDALQTSLRGAVSALSIKSIVDYHLKGRAHVADSMLKALNALYNADPGALKLAGEQTNAVLELVSRINVAEYQPAGGAQYDDQDDFHMALMQTAALIKADVGLEVSAIDLGGWDTHKDQADDLTQYLTTLAAGLAAFQADMGVLMSKITVVVMSEFGRRVQQNASRGTDHGHGGVMLVQGGHVASKPVITEWPGLAREQLSDGDLAITIDYRDVLSEILSVRVGNPQIEAVFPGFTPTPRGVVVK